MDLKLLDLTLDDSAEILHDAEHPDVEHPDAEQGITLRISPTKKIRKINKPLVRDELRKLHFVHHVLGFLGLEDQCGLMAVDIWTKDRVSMLISRAFKKSFPLFEAPLITSRKAMKLAVFGGASFRFDKLDTCCFGCRQLCETKQQLCRHLRDT